MGYRNEKKPRTIIPRSKCLVRVGTSLYPYDYSNNSQDNCFKKQKQSNPKSGSSQNLSPSTKRQYTDKNAHKTLKKATKSACAIEKLVEEHNFPNHAQFSFPSKYFSLIKSQLEKHKRKTHFYRIECTLGDILFAPGFLFKYIKSNSCMVISETQLDHQDVYAISGGRLHLSLQCETFKRAGLSNVQFSKPDPRGIGSSTYRMTYDLRSSSSITGNATFDRLKWSLQNTLVDLEKDVHTFAISTLDQQGMPVEMDDSLALYFHELSKKRKVAPFEAYDLVPDIYERKSRAVPEMCVPKLTFEPINAHAGDLGKSINKGPSDTTNSFLQSLSTFPKDTAQEIIQEWAFNINDWLTLLSLDSDRTQFIDTIDRHLSSYELLDKASSAQDITVVEIGGGLIPPAYIYKLWTSMTDALKSDDSGKDSNGQEKTNDVENSWVALNVRGVEDAPVSWADKKHVYTPYGGENQYSLIKLPSSNTLSKLSSEFQNLEKDVSGNIDAALEAARILEDCSNKTGSENGSKKRKDIDTISTSNGESESQSSKPVYPYLVLQMLDANDP